MLPFLYYNNLFEREEWYSMQDKLTGYPSIDKPWLKYYREEDIKIPLPKMKMYDYVFEKNKDRLSAIALDYYGTRITYQEFFEKIQKAAAFFHQLGIKEGDVVTIMSLITPETIYSIYALNYLGATANMVYMSLSKEELFKCLKLTNSKAMIALELVQEKVKEAVKGMPLILLEIDSSMSGLAKIFYRLKHKRKKDNEILLSQKIKDQRNIAKMATYKEDRTAIIVYTSGTTGSPKGVMLSDDSINTVAHGYCHNGFEYEKEDTMMTFMPPFLAIGLSLCIHMPLVLGLTSVIETNPEPRNVTKRYWKVKPSHFIAAPSNILEIMSKKDKQMKWCKTFGGGGESLNVYQERYINDELKKAHSKTKYSTGYGMSEFAATTTLISDKAWKEGTLGIPLISSTVRIIDTETREELGYDTEGEICFSTPSRMIGYYNNEAATKEVMWQEDGKTWIRTGDLGKVDRDGFVHFIGRLKRIYIVKGTDGTLYKLFPARIEEELVKLEGIIKCAVCAIEDAEKLHKAIAFVESEKPDDELQKAIFKHCKKVLPSHSIPQSVVRIEAIPLTQSGKTDYRKLEKYCMK